MATKTYSADVLVLSKTRLKESDLILTMLDRSGRQISAVAKGAMKPNSQTSARLEMFNEAHVLLAVGRNLDIVKESRLIRDNSTHLADSQKMASCSVICEFIKKSTDKNIECDRLYDMATSAIHHIADCSEDVSPYIAAAALLKAISMLGMRPSMGHCVICGREVGIQEDSLSLGFSIEHGGVICDACLVEHHDEQISKELLRLLDFMIYGRFDNIASARYNDEYKFQLLMIAAQMSKLHANANLKSMRLLVDMD